MYPATWDIHTRRARQILPGASVLSQRFVHYTIVFPGSSAGGDAPAMRAIVKRSRRPEGAGKATRRTVLRRPITFVGRGK